MINHTRQCSGGVCLRKNSWEWHRDDRNSYLRVESCLSRLVAMDLDLAAMKRALGGISSWTNNNRYRATGEVVCVRFSAATYIAGATPLLAISLLPPQLIRLHSGAADVWCILSGVGRADTSPEFPPPVGCTRPAFRSGHSAGGRLSRNTSLGRSDLGAKRCSPHHLTQNPSERMVFVTLVQTTGRKWSV